MDCDFCKTDRWVVVKTSAWISFCAAVSCVVAALCLPLTVSAQPVEGALQQQLLQAYRARGADYKPRTLHYNDKGAPKYINRLIREDSPYLLQHAHNPVNWYAWGKEAFEQAVKQSKPVFLSIGYATCHWCHVMERESFENEAIAEQMNEQFIAVKVDREQLPDVDAMYMTGVQVITGRGGWPLSGFLQSDGKLFHGATYMPPDMFSQVMNQVSGVWNSDRARIAEFANELASAIAQNSKLTGEVKEIGVNEIALARETLLLGFDSFQGGFGPAPKFPRESTLFFLLDLARRDGDIEALEAVDFSLIRMSAGGIHDHIGGGFHRYAVDDDWLIPHFEKMLYTQASLLKIYLQAFELTGKLEHARTARRIADYVLRDMTSPEGGFYSATDADSEGGEGRYFVWTLNEITEILSKEFSLEDAQFATAVWGVTEAGNFDERNILRLEDSLPQVSRVFGIKHAELAEKLNRYSQALLKYRDRRVPPLTDNKIITEWNGMMSAALVHAGRVLQEPRYLQAGIRAVNFLLKNNRKPDGSLWRANFEGRSSTAASQADYAYLALALVTLFDETGDRKWLDLAEQQVGRMNRDFWDAEQHGYFIGTADPMLPVRPKALFDNAAPTGNAVALKVLVKLANRTGNDAYMKRAATLVAAFSQWLSGDGSGFGYFLTGTNDLLNGERGAHRYMAKGKVKASVGSIDGNSVEVVINVAPGWHINSNTPLQDYLIPTELSLSEEAPFAQVHYPTPVVRRLGFQNAELSLLEDEIRLHGELPTSLEQPFANVELQLQACSDEICLAPETLVFKVPLVIASNPY